jgi:hypothetical protein
MLSWASIGPRRYGAGHDEVGARLDLEVVQVVVFWHLIEKLGAAAPGDRLPPGYRKQGLRFTDAGFPDFEPFAKTLPNGKKYVEIRYTGSRPGDFAAANAKAGYAKTPTDYTWHHSEELGRMYLVPLELHKQVKHTGGVATYKHVTGDVASYAN